MKSYQVAKDINRIIRYFKLTQESFSHILGISRMSLSRILSGRASATPKILESIYSYAYNLGMHLNQSKADLFLDDRKGRSLLFHGTGGEIIGSVDNAHSKSPNDFGNGFYAGESLTQSASWVCEHPTGNVYSFYFDPNGHYKRLSFQTDRDWMFAILYYRGAFAKFAPNSDVLKIVKAVEQCDFLIAPIADNQMYQILNNFADNQITDEQCIHALSSTNLGMQYVFKSMKACNALIELERLYLCEEEKRDYKQAKQSLSEQSQSKADLALIEYRRKGHYFDEIFKRVR